MSCSVPTCFSQENLTPTETVLKFYELANEFKGEEAVSMLSPELKKLLSATFDDVGYNGFCYGITRGGTIGRVALISKEIAYYQGRDLVKIIVRIYFIDGVVVYTVFYLQEIEGGWEFIINPES